MRASYTKTGAVAVGALLMFAASSAGAQEKAAAPQPANPAAGKSASSSGSGQNRIGSIVDYSEISDPDRAWRGLNIAQHTMYTGIIPNVRDTLPHIRPFQKAANRRRGRNRLTWLGYQRMADKTRVFIQTGRVASYTVARGDKPNTLLVVLDDTQGSLYNFRRLSDARYYPRSVKGFCSYPTRGRKTTVKIATKLEVPFRVTQDGNYIYVDFDDAGLEAQLMPVRVGGEEAGLTPAPDSALADPNLVD